MRNPVRWCRLSVWGQAGQGPRLWVVNGGSLLAMVLPSGGALYLLEGVAWSPYEC
ncbi:hypothetical protein BC826DRAFT_993779 [Russula brevipes]|nr:hypothetical protein BC826DRAFT_993779 [Russula brevipes]